MLGFFKRLFGFGSKREQKIDPDAIVNEQWQADFSREDEPNKPARVRFSIVSDKSYCAYLENNALLLGIKKTGCMAWTDNTFYRYQDLYIKGSFIIDPLGGYAAAGFIFRMVDSLTYYIALVSSKGFFRLDLVRNSVPLTLAGWTEAPGLRDSKGTPIEFDLELICAGSRILLVINGFLAGSWDDISISEGRIAFAAASYEHNIIPSDPISITEDRFTAVAKLLEFNLDSRIEEVDKRYVAAEQSASSDSYIQLAETYTAMGQAGPALIHLRKAWEIRENLNEELTTAADAVVLAAIHSNEPVRTVKELLWAAKLSLALELFDDAEEYIKTAKETDGAEGAVAAVPSSTAVLEINDLEAALLYSRSCYADLIKLAEQNYDKLDSLYKDPSSFYNLLGHAYFNTGNYLKAAEAYDHSFFLNEKNGFSAKNAAAAYELLNQEEKKEEQTNIDYIHNTLDRYIKAGRAFLADNRYEELGLLIPKFHYFGKEDWEARALAGKWAFGIEQWETARKELLIAEQLRKAKRNTPSDPAIYYLLALLLVREGKKQEAQSLFEKAVKYAPDYPLFRFKLAENRLFLNSDPDDPLLTSDMEAALAVKEDDESFGWIHNFAAHVALSKGNVEAAGSHMDIAAARLGDIPAVRVNQAVSHYLQGLEKKALDILESRPEDDPEGLMANCAGNLLVRSRRFEEADEWYRRALTIAPLNMLYRYNRGSCLIELKRYGEADDVLTAGSKKISPETNPDMLELIAFVAVKKGEYNRAETAIKTGLKINPNHGPSLLQLGWIRAFSADWNEVAGILDRLEELELNDECSKGRDDLKGRLNDALYKTVVCNTCKREWQVERNPRPIPGLRLYAMPPDEMPAGTCPGCNTVYCVGCRKDKLDDSGRFVCPDCGKTLKLTDDGLKALLSDWAKKNIKKKKKKVKDNENENENKKENDTIQADENISEEQPSE